MRVTLPPSYAEVEIASQPHMWRKAAACAEAVAQQLPPGRVAFVGCGTSFYVALTVAALWESHGRGEADAYPASEMPARGSYDYVVALSRSGTTTEVVDLLERLTGTRRVATVQVGLASFQSAHFTNWPILMAGTLMSQIPLLLLFIAGQRYFVSSIASTGFK